MNVASLDLCKELYELSGWKDTLGTYIEMVDKKWRVSFTTSLDPQDIPAYDLGYLLRKLPKFTAEKTRGIVLDLFSETEWRIGYPGDLLRVPYIYADTPEDACAKLTLALFKEGILTK